MSKEEFKLFKKMDKPEQLALAVFFILNKEQKKNVLKYIEKYL